MAPSARARYYMTATVMKAFNTEAMKLAALGVTVVASSGDDGAPNQIQTSNTAPPICACDLNSGRLG
jgi:subtilase family serine protease